MNRRHFLKISTKAGLMTLITPSGFTWISLGSDKSSLENAFLNPPKTSKPFTWWHWMNGNISRKGVTLDLEAMKRIGIGGVQCFDVGDGIPSGPVKYLSEKWLELTEHALGEANRLGLEFSIHNCPGWSSTGGPWITPNLGMQQITWSQAFVDGGKHVSIDLPQPSSLLDYYKDVRVVAYPTLPDEPAKISVLNNWRKNANYPVDPKINYPKINEKKVNEADKVSPSQIINAQSVLDLTGYITSNGHLEWDAPSGKWTILRIGHTVIYQTNAAAPFENQGLECDKFNKKAFEFHFQKIFNHLLPIFQKRSDTSKIGILIDSYEVYMQNWTPGLSKEFYKRRGYDITAYLPALTGRLVGSVEETERFYYDFRRTHADLIAENYYGYCNELCKKYNLIGYVEPYGNGPLSDIEVGSKMDITVGEFWARGPLAFYSTKLAASISHVFGKRLDGLQIVGAEAYTGDNVLTKWQEHPYSLKGQGDLMFTFGLSRFIFHSYAHQIHSVAKPGMTMGPHGIHFNRGNTWFEDSKGWMNYLSRCQAILQRGLFRADILCYVGEDKPGRVLQKIVDVAAGIPTGYDWDIADDTVLLKRIAISNNNIVLPDGIRYKVLVLADIKKMSLPVLKKIKKLVIEGMTLIGAPPLSTPGLKDAAINEVELLKEIEMIWGTDPLQEGTKRLGKGAVYNNKQPLDKIFKTLRLYPDVSFSSKSGDALINYTHRTIEGAEVYFIANRRRITEQVTATFRITSKQPELWNPSTGKIIPIKIYQISDQFTTIPLQFDPVGSYFIVFRKTVAGMPITSIEKDGNMLVSAQPLSEPVSSKYGEVVNNFSITAWVKPEIDNNFDGNFGGRHITSYLIYPPEGELLYGKGHASCCWVIARNGIVVGERSLGDIRTTLRINFPISGWTHVGLIYNEGTPSVYINGKLTESGKQSSFTIHPGMECFKQDKKAWIFEGDTADVRVLNKVLNAEEIAHIASKEAPPPTGPLPVQFLTDNGDILFNNSGNYVINKKTASEKIKVSLPNPINISQEWQLSFPPGLGAPERIKLPELISLHKHPEEGVKYFSGTVTYSKQFAVQSNWLNPAHRLFLDLGRVEVIAGVKINGKDKGVLWKAPYTVELTGDLIKGINNLEVKLTNLWPNRLIGDEQYPEENAYREISTSMPTDAFTGGILKLPDWFLQDRSQPKSKRIAFTTWKHFKKNDPLLESGLIGPVFVRQAYSLNV